VIGTFWIGLTRFPPSWNYIKMAIPNRFVIFLALSTIGLSVISISEQSETNENTFTEASHRTLILAKQLFIKIFSSPKFVLWWANIGNFFTTFDSFYNRISGAEKERKADAELAEFEDKLSNISGDVKDTVGNVRGEGVMSRYSYDEKVIRSSLRSLIVFSELSDSEFLKKEFLSDAKSLKSCLFHLMSGLTGDLVGGDILLTIKDLVRCDENKFQQTAEVFLDLLAAGITVHANYIFVKRISSSDNGPFQREMENNTERIIQRVQSIGKSCRNETNVDEELERILRKTPQDNVINFNSFPLTSY